MSRIAVVALLFPPVQQIGAKRPLRLANYLADQGHAVTVYAVHPGSPQLDNYAGVDPGTESSIDPRVRVVRTPSIHGFKIVIGWRDRFRRRGTPQGAPPPARVQPNPTGSAGAISRGLSRVEAWFGIPDAFTGWIITTLPVLVLRSLVFRPDAILVTAPPWSSLVLATLAGKLLRIPVYADFRDPWTLNPYVKTPALSTRLERWVVSSSRSIIANTETIADEFRRAFPTRRDRVFAVYNGYDRDTRRRIEEMARRVSRDPSGPFVLSHIGTLYPSRMPRRLAALLAAVAAGWTASRTIRFRLVGKVWDPAPLIQEFRTAGVSHALELVGEVRSEQALLETVQADVLLLLQSGTAQQVPAKIFEYAFAGNYLVSVADTDSETTRLLTRYDLGGVFDVDTTPDTLGRYLLTICHQGLAPSSPPGAFLRDFEGERLAAQLAAIMVGRADGRATGA